jgi:hypothetical protein
LGVLPLEPDGPALGPLALPGPVPLWVVPPVLLVLVVLPVLLVLVWVGLDVVPVDVLLVPVEALPVPVGALLVPVFDPLVDGAALVEPPLELEPLGWVDPEVEVPVEACPPVVPEAEDELLALDAVVSAGAAEAELPETAGWLPVLCPDPLVCAGAPDAPLLGAGAALSLLDAVVSAGAAEAELPEGAVWLPVLCPEPFVWAGVPDAPLLCAGAALSLLDGDASAGAAAELLPEAAVWSVLCPDPFVCAGAADPPLLGVGAVPSLLPGEAGWVVLWPEALDAACDPLVPDLLAGAAFAAAPDGVSRAVAA